MSEERPPGLIVPRSQGRKPASYNETLSDSAVALGGSESVSKEQSRLFISEYTREERAR
jgi:hypothetical protein